MSKMHPSLSKGQEHNDLRVPLLRDYADENQNPFENIYDRPLRCCGCGIGWCSFLLGCLLPLFWFYGTFLFYAEHYRYDPRERMGLAACAIAALMISVAAVITVTVILAQHSGLTSIFRGSFILF